MSLRLAASPDQMAAAADLDRSITVNEAAAILGCDPSTVRKLLRKRKLLGHRIGLGEKRGGVRVQLASIRAYQARRAIGADAPDGPAPAPHRAVQNAAHREAVAALRNLGLRF